LAEQQSSTVLFTDLGLVKELEDREFRNQFFRTEREIDIPAQIKTLRKLRKLKQEELADLVGTKQSAISRLERSQEAKFELETLVKLAEALDARLSVLIEPYETVIARYRAEQTASKASAASAGVEARQQFPAQSAATATTPDEVRLPSMSESHGIGRDRKQSDYFSYPGAPPERSSVPA
jgi:transcriptional regulator with XRE-family HTH domain